MRKNMYKCIESWKRHSAGDIISDWEYKKLPQNILKHFQLVQNNRKNDLPVQTDDIVEETVNVVVDPAKIVEDHPFKVKKRSKINMTADIENIIDNSYGNQGKDDI